MELPCEISLSHLSLGTILKAAGVSIVCEEEGLPGRLLSYMELVRELDRDRLFVLVGLRSYCADEELIAFFEDVRSRGFRLLLLDAWSGERLPQEVRYTVDADLCEF